MGLLIFLRTDHKISHFRRNLMRLISAPNSNRLLLCSGYVSEGKRYSVLDDGLLNAIRTANVQVTTVAGMFRYNAWKNRYDNFVKKLKNNHVPTTSGKLLSNWHAKVAMKLSGKTPVAGLIGSSNLTRPAYGQGYKRFNYEADVLIWTNNPINDKHFRTELEDWVSDPLGPMDSVLNDKIKQADEETRLKALYNRIMEQTNL